MSKPRRASLGGRNNAAIAQNSDASEPQASTPEPSKEGPRPPRETSSPPTGRSAGGGTTRQAIYFPAELFEQAKGAYLADWRGGGHADTFAVWIGLALDAHAARTPAQRAQLAQPAIPADTRTGASRSFNLETATVDRVRRAIAEDQDADRWTSLSAWSRDAIAAAVEAARARAGGTLPTPPARLPNRLRR